MKNLSGDSNKFRTIQSGEKDFARALCSTVTEPLLILDKDFKILTTNEGFCQLFNLENKDISGTSVFDLNDGQWDKPELHKLLKEELFQEENIKDLHLPFEFKEERLVLSLNASRIQLEAGEEDLFFLTFRNRLEHNLVNFSVEDYKRSIDNIFVHTPAIICILRGPEFVYELANDSYFKFLRNREIIGKSVKEAFPEAKSQGFLEKLKKVYKTGEPFIGNEIPIKLNIGENRQKLSYLDFVYQPTRNSKGKIDGIFVHAVDVTEKVIARKEVEESEIKLRNFIDTVPAILWLTAKDGSCYYLNKNWYSYTGQKPKEAEGFGWLKAIHPEEREIAGKAFIEANREQKPFHITYRLKTHNGKYRWVMDNGTPKYTVDGEFEGMIGTVVDVHEDKINAELVREKEHRLRTVVEEATVAMAVYTGPEMEIELANDAMVMLWGKDRSIVGKTLHDAIPELDGQPFHKLLKNVFTTGEMYWGKEERADLIINKKLETRYFNYTYKPLRDENGEIYGVLNMALDVTRTFLSQNLLKESESHFRQLSNVIPNKVAHTDSEGNYVYFNQSWLDYTGAGMDELRTEGYLKFVHPGEREEALRKWKRSLLTEGKFEMEARFLHKSGKYKWHIIRAEAIKDENGKLKMWVGTTTEIHKIKEEEKRKEDFLKMVSHELKTPITSIKGYVQLLLSILNTVQNPAFDSIPLKPSLERIDHQIIRLTRLISEILDLSRIEEDKLQLQKSVFSLNDLVDQTIQDIRFTNTQHNLNVDHNFYCNIYADKDRIGQVLINFITNAIKYSPDHKEIKVCIEQPKQNLVQVTVKDKGIGIDKTFHKDIFKRFYRISGESEDTYSGFGIGLYLSNEIIQRHKGTVKVKSQLGKGSDFSFILSAATEDLDN
jgi:PAS domain S-box-containing protein